MRRVLLLVLLLLLLLGKHEHISLPVIRPHGGYHGTS
jgi:hypothetical protein